MHRLASVTGLALAILLIAAVAPVSAQYIQVYSPPVVVSPVTYSYYAPPAPVYYTPSVSYYTPSVSYYSAPAVSYYAPAPVVSYAPPAYYAPGAVTTRSFVGLGIFRPRGVYYQSYYTPGYYWP